MVIVNELLCKLDRKSEFDFNGILFWDLDFSYMIMGNTYLSNTFYVRIQMYGRKPAFNGCEIGPGYF